MAELIRASCADCFNDEYPDFSDAEFILTNVDYQHGNSPYTRNVCKEHVLINVVWAIKNKQGIIIEPIKEIK